MTDSPKKDFNPKHRVVGAIVLVALAVIVLPQILDRGHDDRRVDDPAAPAVQNQVFVADLSKTDGAPAAAQATSIPPASEPVAAPVAPPPPVATAATPAAPKVSTPAPAAKPAAASADKGFYVQVGIFSSQANARQLADKLKQHGYRVRVEQARLPSGDALRVRVGPYAQDAQAQAARAAIQRKLDVQGIVRAY